MPLLLVDGITPLAPSRGEACPESRFSFDKLRTNGIEGVRVRADEYSPSYFKRGTGGVNRNY